MSEFREEKDRSSAGTETSVNTKNYIAGKAFGCFDPSIQARLDQDITLYRKGYEDGLRDGLAQGPAHPAVQRSVANFFGNWPGKNGMRGDNRRG